MNPDVTRWLLTATERDNPHTRLDDAHPGEQAWSTGNLVRPLVDGATYFQAFRKVVLPLAAPGLVTAGLLPAFFVWNEFLLALTLTRSPGAFTVPVSVANFTGSQKFEVPLGTISAASVVITVPLVLAVIIFQKRIVAGMTAGAVKG